MTCEHLLELGRDGEAGSPPADTSVNQEGLCWTSGFAVRSGQPEGRIKIALGQAIGLGAWSLEGAEQAQLQLEAALGAMN